MNGWASTVSAKFLKSSVVGVILASALIPSNTAQAQLTDQDEITELFVEWMVGPSTTGPRAFIRTEREILQTGPETAEFVRGSAQFVVADGAIGGVWRDQIPGFEDEWDTDQDGWRDVVENEFQSGAGPTPNGTNWADDPQFNPPSSQIPGDVFWTPLANGLLVPVRPEGSAVATIIRPFAFPGVRLNEIPPSDLERPISLFDYSTPFFLSVDNTSTALLGLAFYHWSREYVGRAGGARMEGEIRADSEMPYGFEFPSVSNPNLLGGVKLNHLPVPNGTLAIGPRKPNWTVKEVETIISFDAPPEKQRWTNGRLVFDPALPNTFRWDNIVADGLANPNIDQLAVSIQADDGTGTMVQIWPQIPGGAIRPIALDNFTFQAGALYGTPGQGGNPTSPLSLDAEFVMRYTRNAAGASSGDVSTVTHRVPVTLEQSYESWKRFFFPGANLFLPFVSGPGADPDGDLLTNRVEFENGLNPLLIDSDGNGVTDTFEVNQDTDGDSIPDWLEVIIGFDPELVDSDGDGLPDPLEDRDFDGLYDFEEYRGVPQNPGDDPADPATVLFRTDLNNVDSDGDGLQDGFEIFVTLTNPSAADGDGDDLNDLEELQAGSDPDVADSDGDELLDGEEVKLFGTDPLLDDTDGDGVLDIDEDHDRDLLTTRLEREITANTGITYDPLSEDSDGNGITDDAEDADGDGLNNLLEVQLFPTYFAYLADSDGNGTSDFDEDFDGDGLGNGDELFVYGTDPTRSDTLGDGTQDGDRDPDGDGLGILDEVEQTLTDPLDPDSDGDGVPDGNEDPDQDLLINADEVNVWGSNPRSSDTDLDGIPDGVEVFVTLTDPTLVNSDGVGPTDYFEDSDGDFLPDGFEVAIYSGTLDALILEGQSAFAGPDSDGDGLLDIHELLISGTDFGNPDTDGDGILDGAEDTDGDGLTNAQELPPFGQITTGTELLLGGTNPQVTDTDGDGLDDGVEVNTTLTNPLDIDSDDDGFGDGSEVDAGRDPIDPADFPIEQLITRPRVRSFPVAAGTPPFGNGFTVEVERLAASVPVGGVGYLYTFQGSVDLTAWSDLPSADWNFTNTGPGATGDPAATYVGSGQLPSVQFFRVLATPVSITQP